jgi:F-type H+-transporting ATPase subunit gamma
MAGGEERILRRRIKSVNSTKKITRAMELIAATRIVKAQQRVAAARPYADQITEVIRSLASSGAGAGQPMLTAKADVKTVAYVVCAGDRGLAGAYNSAVIRLAERALQADVAQGRNYVIVAVGKKTEDYFKFRGYQVHAAFKGFTDSPTYENARDIARSAQGLFDAGEVDVVELAYTQFLSAGSQRPILRRFMPIELDVASTEGAAGAAPAGATAGYEFEPEPTAILSTLLPRYVESRLFAAILDAAASEHAGRQRAMKSATENAGELVKKLSRQMNTARQASITTEIMEIVGGAEALKNASTELIPNQANNPDLFQERTQEAFDRQSAL